MGKARWDDGYIGRRIRLRDLHVFSTVAQRGSMAKAAAELGITQPAVSRIVGEVATPSVDFSELRERKVDLIIARLRAPFIRDQRLDDLDVRVLFEDELVVVA